MAEDKETKVITKTALRRLMKNEAYADIVSAKAVLKLLDYLNDLAIDITKKAIKIAQNANRKTITKRDIKLAIRGP
ncbi:MAG: histone [Candidatus Lokiarchaeota archaeon]|nr:histone [Candidatus Lokiarchaeota archaeon]